MMTLDRSRVRWIFIHTAAFRGEAGVERIRQWHLDRGWDDIGYHFVVRRDGEVERGRSLDFMGAHVRGANSKSIGICCEGDGDSEPHTDDQRAALLELVHDLMKSFTVTVDNVLGHREVNALIDADQVGDQYRTGKTCPGEMVDMEQIREALMDPHMVDSIERETS